MAEKSFKNFLNLPEKNRMMIIDEMEPADRCRFTRTSKTCNKEAKSSKNYLEFLRFNYQSMNKLQISIKYRGYDYFKAKNDFTLEIKKEEDSKKYMTCIKCTGEELWRIPLNDSTDLVEFAVECFTNFLKLHQGHLKKLSIESGYYRDGVIFDIGDICFEQLESLSMKGVFDSIPFITKTRYPLKTLYIQREGNFEYPMDKIYPVQDSLFLNIKLNNDQFSQLSASTVCMNIGDITEDHIFNFVQSWQNGTIGRKLKWFQLNLLNSSFDMKRLFRLFGDNKYTEENSSLYQLFVPHHKDAGKKARISHVFFSLQLHFLDEKDEPVNMSNMFG